MPTLTAPLSTLQKALAAVTPHIDRDAWTPVLDCINVINDDDGIALLATDRYSAIEYRIAGVTVAEPEQIRDAEVFLLPSKLVAHVRAYGTNRDLDDDDLPPLYAPTDWTVRITLTDVREGDLSSGNLLVSIIDDKNQEWSRQRFDSLRTSVPVIGKLFPTDPKPLATFSVASRIIERIAATASVLQDENGPSELTFSSSGNTDGDRKPAVQVEFAPAPVRMLFVDSPAK